MRDDRDPREGRKIAAYILLGIAGFIILGNTGILSFFGISSVFGWLFSTIRSLIPAAILVFGVWWLVNARDGEKPVVAWIVTLFGVVLVISQFDLFGLSFGNLFLPMWLIIVAFVIMNPRNILPRQFNAQTEDLGKESNRIKLVAFMGGGDLDFSSQSLTGGEVLAIWGGYELDFSDADMEGDSMELNLYCIMGGVEIIVPPNWDVEKRGAVCIMGGFSNKARCRAEKLELPRKTLVIRGLALMGGGEIRN